MAETGLFGPHPLTEAHIDKYVSQAIGVYALGHTASNGAFYPKYVGRSDVDLNDRLKDHVGSYAQFKYGHYETVKAAFDKECNMYHDFKPQLDNTIHPDRPKGTNYKCPRCNVLG